MKKILFALSLSLMALGLNAQGVSPRIELGASFSNLSYKGWLKNLDSNTKLGARASLALELGMADFNVASLYLAPGLTYKMGGAMEEQNILKKEGKITYHSLSLPVTLGVRFDLFGSLGVSAEVGPYISYAMSANKKIDGTSVDMFGTVKDVAPDLFNKFSDEFKAGIKDKSLFKRFDAGLNGSIALEVSRFYLRAGVEYGFVDQFEGDLIEKIKKAKDETVEVLKDIENANSKHINFFATVGIRF